MNAVRKRGLRDVKSRTDFSETPNCRRQSRSGDRICPALFSKQLSHSFDVAADSTFRQKILHFTSKLEDKLHVIGV
jgi:hypothetical protein